MISNSQIKNIRSLKLKKFRQKYYKFIVEGHKSCSEFLKSKRYNINSIFAHQEWLDSNQNLLANTQCDIYNINPREMAKISLLSTPSDILMVCEMEEVPVNLELNNNILYLDDVQDPGNVGTIIRIADWFGISTVIASTGSADFYNPKVVMASMGSMCNVNLLVNEISNLKVELPNHTIVGTEMQGISVKDYEWPEKSIIVIGNEGKGISSATRELCDSVISIPGTDNRIAESLNAAISAAIICSNIP